MNRILAVVIAALIAVGAVAYATSGTQNNSMPNVPMKTHS
jgi:hypothetical protein